MRPDESRPHGVDPDVDRHGPRPRADVLVREWDTLLAIAVGGVVGAEARYGLAELVPHGDAAWPWATLLTNLIGSFLLGVLMAALGESAAPPRLARPFLGVGVLGGFTTFSTFAVDAYRLLLAHRPLMAVAYLVTSVVVCVLGVLAAMPVTTRLMRRARR
jgi:CrcB protein